MRLKNTRYMQYVAAITGTLSVACLALYGVWPSPILPKIASGEAPFGYITPEESSWLVSCFLFGQILGSVLSVLVLENFGRKQSLLMSGIPLFVCWFPITFTTSVWGIYISRFIAGIAAMIAMNSVMLYNGEIAEKEIRGRLGSTINMLGIMGDLIPLCVGPYISYEELSLLSSAVPLLFLILFYFMPESPYYLIKIGKEDKAKKMLRRLLNSEISDVAFNERIGIIKNTVEEEMKNKSSLLEFLLKKDYRKSLVISFGIYTINQVSGFPAILAYMQSILEYSRESIDPETSSVICGLVQLPTVFIAAALVDRLGRRPLLLISLLGCSLALMSIGVFFYLKDVLHRDISYISWMPAAGILLYIVIRPIGIGTLLYVLMGELFATNIKGHAMAVSTLYKSLLSFAVTRTFEPISNAWGMHVIFGIYTLVCILGTVFVYLVVPETKGKTFAEIREALNKSSKQRTNKI